MTSCAVGIYYSVVNLKKLSLLTNSTFLWNC